MLDWSIALIFPKATGWMISEKVPALSKRMGLFRWHLLPSSCYPPKGPGFHVSVETLVTKTTSPLLQKTPFYCTFLDLQGYIYIYVYIYIGMCIYTYTFLYVHINWFLNDGYTCFFTNSNGWHCWCLFPIFARSKPCFWKVTDHEAGTYLLLTRWPTNLMCEQDAVKDSPLKDDCNPYLKKDIYTAEGHNICTSWWEVVFAWCIVEIAFFFRGFNISHLVPRICLSSFTSPWSIGIKPKIPRRSQKIVLKGGWRERDTKPKF